MTDPARDNILEMHGIHKRFRPPRTLAHAAIGLLSGKARQDTVYAVNGIELSLGKGEVVGLVGESGCGKSTLGRLAAGLLHPSEGQVLYQHQDVSTLPRPQRLAYTLQVQMVFQDPQASLNPSRTIGSALAEPLIAHRLAARSDIPERIVQALHEVGLSAEYMTKYPHQISGGQRQRVGIARALMVSPKVLVCDEPIAALDVSIQAQVINLFMELKEKRGLTYLFISHDLSVVRHISDRVAVMYLGKIVELSTAREIFNHPNHPYTKALLEAAPRTTRRGRKFSPITGEIPSPLALPTGCAFYPRCPVAMPRCRGELPTLNPIAAGHESACFLNDLKG